jgi:NAD(P)-dependent dehydrogenase (short-subunit alcohol dehydrogenase family)
MRTPMKQFGKLEELVGGAIFLASKASSFVTGTILAVDGWMEGGWRISSQRSQSVSVSNRPG